MPTQSKITPMLRQYLEIKEQHQDAILFYRMGDFYEMFFEDARTASKLLGITLTSRNKKNDANKVPMCGFPHHSAPSYIAKLIKAGKKVAICEQTEDPKHAKGLVKREVIRVLSPGVITDEQLLDDKSNHYIAALYRQDKGKEKVSFGISFLDLSTGEFLIGEFSDSTEYAEQIIDQLTRMQPAELIIQEGEQVNLSPLLDIAEALLPGLCLTERSPASFDLSQCRELLQEQFQVINLAGFGCDTMHHGIRTAGVLLDYIQETQKTDISHIQRLIPIDLDSILLIDDSSRRNLELTQTIIGGKRNGSLLAVLDRTTTPMGARLLKHQILFPIQDVQRINQRLDAVTHLFGRAELRQNLKTLFGSVYDMERLNSRMILGSGNGRDMLALKQSLAHLPRLKEYLLTCDARRLLDIGEELNCMENLHDLLNRGIHDEAPINIRDGNIIKPEYNTELDELVSILQDSKQMILQLQKKERERTGIPNLKVGFNKIFGYYLEITKSHISKAPEHYIRKQTLVNAERFITPELKEFENKILGAQDKRLDLEYQLFCHIRQEVAAKSTEILQVAAHIALVDYFTSLADIAHSNHYCRPTVSNGEAITITEGRHPVIEPSLPSGRFVPNDVHLDQENQELLIITGPNMAGKSTILRQTALIVLMAQMGSFVPADKADIGVVDRIFTRVGAMDNLRLGQSTFMVEMNETANILNNATEKSLVILDEIGRGTSTFDGLSIAWAVAEDLVTKNNKGVKTLFATHYHELTDLAKTETRVRNFSIAVREWNETIIFLYKLVKGGTNRSYGIQVAALAGVPGSVVDRASQILTNIEKGELDPHGEPALAKGRKSKKGRQHPDQMSLFPPPADPLRDYINTIEPDTTSPLEALSLLYEIKKQV